MCEINKESPVIILPEGVRLWLLRQMEIGPYEALGAAYNCSHKHWLVEMWEKRPEFFATEGVSLAGSRWDRDGGWFTWETEGNGVEPPPPTEDFYESLHRLLAWYLMNNKGVPSEELHRLVRRTQQIVSALLPRNLGNALIAYMNGPDFFATRPYQKLAQNLALMLNHRVTNEERLELILRICVVRFRYEHELSMSLAWECAANEINNELELFQMAPRMFEDPARFARFYYSQETSFEEIGTTPSQLTRRMKIRMLQLLFVQLTEKWFRLSAPIRQNVLSLEKGLPVYLGFSPEEGEEWFAVLADAAPKTKRKYPR